MPRRLLAKSPMLFTAYLAWGNRGRRRRDFAVALALLIAWVAAVSIYAHADRAAAISTLAWFHRHALFCALVCAMAAGVLVSRRRALNQTASPRTWSAALPMHRWAARCQSLTLDSVPALVLACILAIVFGSMSVLAFVDSALQAPLATWAATTVGVALGVALGYLLPAARPEEMYERSRYVPHRRRAPEPIPAGSLSALGTWPVRHMLASAAPKTFSRAVIPVLLCIPLGSAAADVMLVLGLLATAGALVLLVSAAISVSADAARWLRPLPLQPGVLARRTLTPALAFMCFAAAVESWLLWVLGAGICRSTAIAVLSLSVGMIAAVAGSFFAAHAGIQRTNVAL